MRLGTGQPGATLLTCILRDGSPRTQADMWSSFLNTGGRLARMSWRIWKPIGGGGRGPKRSSPCLSR